MRNNIFYVLLFITCFSCITNDKNFRDKQNINIVDADNKLCNCLKDKFNNLEQKLLEYENKLIEFEYLKGRSSKDYVKLVSFFLDNENKNNFLDKKFIFESQPFFSLDSLSYCYNKHNKKSSISNVTSILLNQNGSLKNRSILLKKKIKDKDFEDASPRFIFLYIIGYMNTHALTTKEVFLNNIEVIRTFYPKGPKLSKEKIEELIEKNDKDLFKSTLLLVNGEKMAKVTYLNYLADRVTKLRDKEILVILENMGGEFFVKRYP